MTDSNKKLGFDTRKIHAGYRSEEHNYAVAVPIYQTASYDLGSVERARKVFSLEEIGSIYTRIGSPTTAVLEQRVADLDGATAAIALASGMAAVSYTLLQLTEGGGRILSLPNIYGGTVDSFLRVYPSLGIGIDYPEDIHDPKSYEKAIREDTKAIFIESISNPNAELVDIKAIAEVAHKHNLPLVVDNTFATPYLFNPFEHGADIVVYSATKALNGHGNTIAGLILENGQFDWGNGKFPQFEKKEHVLRTREQVYRSFLEAAPGAVFTTRIRLTYLNYLGAALSSFDAFLVLQGIETLSERVSKQVSTAKKLIQYLEGKDEVLWVKHPEAKNSTYKELASAYFPKGTGAIFTFGLTGTKEERDAFLDSLELFSYHANVGDARSIIINSPETTHGELNKEQQAMADIPPETVRISVGLEDPEDLINDLERSFQKVYHP
ncbi:O-acetylhomoserine aminocarboxypropyltransferase/cysteine synthase family protein [Sinanaerobacter chloroacetimidivorans]|uniref:homocysteine desulfhydrase n=1 Tax=Sinanaerobacter chloroacetimidivorans TaxID=2818044 RepID=A0A8J7W245_9FIRM|nr:aminotransferase class I/II-fold pyridoxal phosphate-dependent enzyme [Sinanaerobacter chloroacetimidivorans]MBR0599474.1 O-acetylhomoserine aminocarboxypropyltransferase/cysteine synthase [Sinanaerobacter chloroacetimidivorans]